MDKLKIKKGKKSKSSSGLFKKKKAEAIPPLENPEPDPLDEVSSQSTQPPSQGSVISIQQARVDTSNNSDRNGTTSSMSSNMDDQPSRPQSSRPQSSRPTSARPSSSRPTSRMSEINHEERQDSARPRSARSPAIQRKTRVSPAGSTVSMSRDNRDEEENSMREASNIGSSASLQVPKTLDPKLDANMSSKVSLMSKEAWTDADVTPTPSMNNSVISVRESASSQPDIEEKPAASKWFPSDMNEAHAYVPYLYCRDLIAKMMEDMKKMKKKHMTIVTDIENNYKTIEDKTQGQFNSFVINLRGGYSNKVKTFRQVIEVHRLELSQKQQYWDEALASLSERNKNLLEDKKKLLISNKLEFDRLEKERDEVKEDLSKKLDEANKRLDDNSKDLIQRLEAKDAELQDLADQLAQERAENERMQAELEDLRNRPVPVPVVSERQKSARPASSVVVTDLSDKERQSMDKERKDMEDERKQIKEERKAMEREAAVVADQRDDLRKKLKELQDEVNTSKKEAEEWKGKYEEMKRRVEEIGDLPEQYAKLKAQYDALANVAKVNTPEEKEKCEVALEKASADKAMMEEEKEKLEREVTKWEEDFKQKNKREPSDADKVEIHKSLEEADDMVKQLERQVTTLEAMKNGEVPEAPPVVPVVVKEPEVKIIEVRVPDPEVVAMLEMTQRELDAMRKQLRAMRDDKTSLKSQNSKLNSNLADARRDTAQVQAANDELEKKIAELLAGGAGQGAGGEDEELRRLLREKEKELRDQELKHKNELRDAEKQRKAMEKDLTKVLKKLQKALKNQGDPEKEKRLNRLLQVVAAQVKDIHSSNPKASNEVEKRLKEAENEKTKKADTQEKSQQEYGDWAQDFEDENGRPPKAADRETSNKGQRLYEMKKDSDWEAEEADLLQTALDLIATGSLTEEAEEEVQAEKPKARRRVPGQIVEEQEWEEREVVMEDKITEKEEKITLLEDKIVDLESEKDLLENNTKDLEDKIAELEALIQQLRGEVDVLKDTEQALRLDMKEMEEKQEIALKEKDREHQKEMEKKEKEFEEQKKEMETDIAKLVKLVDKLKKRLARLDKNKAPDETDTEKEDEAAEDKISDLESQMAELKADNKQLKDRNWELEGKITDAERQLTGAESKLVELSAAAEAATANAAELEKVNDDLEALRRKIKELENLLWDKDKELRERQVEHEKEIREKEREKKEQLNDIEKLVRLVEKLKRRIKALKGKDDDDDLEGMSMEDKVDKLEEDLTGLEADREHLKDCKKELEDKVDELSSQLAVAEGEIAELKADVGLKEQLDATNDELQLLRKKVKDLEGELRDVEKALKDKDIEMRDMKNEHDRQMREKEMQEREMKSDIKKMLKQMDKMKKKLKMREDEDSEGPDMSPVAESEEDRQQLEAEVTQAEDKARRLEDRLAEVQGNNQAQQRDMDALKQDNKKLENKLQELQDEVDRLRDQPVVPAGAAQGDVEELLKQLEGLQREVDRAEGEAREERVSHDITRQELEAMRRQLQMAGAELSKLRDSSQAAVDKETSKKQAEIDNLEKKLKDSKKRIDNMEAEKLKALPPEAAQEIKKARDRVAEVEREKDNLEVNTASQAAELREMKNKVSKLENDTKTQRTQNSDAENKIRKLRQEKDAEIKRLEATSDRKLQQRADQEKKKIAALEQMIKELKWSGPNAGSTDKAPAKRGGGGGHAAGGGGADSKQLKVLQEKLEQARQDKADMAARVKEMKAELKAGGGGTSGGGGDSMRVKKLEKLNEELMKKLEDEKKKNEKNNSNTKKKDDDIKELAKEIAAKDAEIAKLKAEMKALGKEAKEAVEATQKAKELSKEVKRLTEENKQLSESFNTERVLRKKYYNMVEDMKGKIRVYARVRPLSKSELERGNVSICKSPDEYTINIDSNRGLKEFQFDQIFMPEVGQQRVFEDTNNLIQSAVDGYNVCIFAYGQTGSGKTFTIIGDKEQNFPGIAPRAFQGIFQLIEENKKKFSFKVNCYMLELYNDKLLDLFGKPGDNHDDKLEIKKDKKGLVVVQGAEVKAARNAKELMALFEEGSKTRHVASHKMNAESSRSHLVIGILIESTNKSTGQVIKGKLSLVDLAGSERAAKTGASAEQLKEAMSINKSLSALGDVISALSSEQQFIPYRNNKLTMLMQDSLGGNAKTLMFVNVSPADYNADETVISLTYASRVKLITNDAQKNQDNKEIARLKAIVNKLKKGDAVDDDV